MYKFDRHDQRSFGKLKPPKNQTTFSIQHWNKCVSQAETTTCSSQPGARADRLPLSCCGRDLSDAHLPQLGINPVGDRRLASRFVCALMHLVQALDRGLGGSGRSLIAGAVLEGDCLLEWASFRLEYGVRSMGGAYVWMHGWIWVERSVGFYFFLFAEQMHDAFLPYPLLYYIILLLSSFPPPLGL